MSKLNQRTTVHGSVWFSLFSACSVYDGTGTMCILPISPAYWLLATAVFPLAQFLLLLLISFVHWLFWLLANRRPDLREKRFIGGLLPSAEKFRKTPYIRTACALILSSCKPSAQPRLHAAKNLPVFLCRFALRQRGYHEGDSVLLVHSSRRGDTPCVFPPVAQL